MQKKTLIALIESPYQAFVIRNLLDELSNSFGRVAIFIVKKPGIGKDNYELMLREIIDLNVQIITVTKYRLFNLLYLFIQLFLSNSIAIGNLMSPWMELVMSFKSSWKRIFILEDGTSLSVDFDEIAKKTDHMNQPISFVSIISQPKSLKNASHEWLRINNPVVRKSKHTVFDDIMNDDSLIFLGSSFVEYEGVCAFCYNDFVVNVLEKEYKKNNIKQYYFPHRREVFRPISSNIKIIEKTNIDFEYIRFLKNHPINIHKTKLISFPSTAISLMAISGLPKYSEVMLVDFPFDNKYSNDRVNRIIEDNILELDKAKISWSLIGPDFLCMH